VTPPVFEVRWTPTVLRLLKLIRDRKVQRLLVDAGKSLSVEPEKRGKPLWGPLQGYRSLRAVGQRYRLIYKVEPQRVLVWIVATGRREQGDRRDVYELARRLFRQGLL